MCAKIIQPLKLSFLCLLAVWMFTGASPAQAACASPSGNAGDILYNDAQSILQYCNGTSWIESGSGPKSGGGCTSPVGTKGQVIYNADHRIMQYCNSFEWVAMGSAGASGGGGSGWIAVDSGSSHACGIKSDSTLWCWGWNANGQLGDNSTTNRTVPTPVSGGGSWKAVSAGGSNATGSHSCGIKSDDTLWCWGLNSQGQLGDNSTTQRLVPTAISGGGTWKSVSTGNTHSCGIKTDNTLWCWGDNAAGQLGDGISPTDSLIPVENNDGGAWKMVSAGYWTTCGITSTDALFCWGSNGNGQYGDGTTDTNDKPTPAGGGGTWKLVSTQSQAPYTCGIKTDDTAWCWGYNDSGQLGDNSITQRLVPTAVNGGGTWKNVSGGMAASGTGHTCGIKADDTVWCWGNNNYGQLGDGTQNSSLVPVTFGAGGTWKSISLGNMFACGILSDDTLKCWGSNAAGQLGNNTVTSVAYPVAIAGNDEWLTFNSGASHVCGIKTNNTLWCWGYNPVGELGDGTTTTRYTQAQVSGGGSWKLVSTSGNNSSSRSVCAIKTDDTLWCWGYNSNGQLGDNSTTNRTVPTAIDGGGTWKTVDVGWRHACGIKSDDTLWCWGENFNGQLGINSTLQKQIPTAVNGGGTWQSVSAGASYTCGVKIDGSMLCWGVNGNGGLGDNSTTQRLVPTAVNGGGTWLKVSVESHSCGIKSDNTLWCWGSNLNGKLGDNSTTQRLVPTAVNGGGSWKDVDAGNSSTCGIKSDDSLWCWGYNGSGELGDTTTTQRLVPTAVYTEYTWRLVQTTPYQVNFTCAINKDNRMFCWGAGSPTPYSAYVMTLSTTGVSPSCSVPAGDAGTILYNSDSGVLQYCDGVGWAAAGKY